MKATKSVVCVLVSAFLLYAGFTHDSKADGENLSQSHMSQIRGKDQTTCGACDGTSVNSDCGDGVTDGDCTVCASSGIPRGCSSRKVGLGQAYMCDEDEDSEESCVKQADRECYSVITCKTTPKSGAVCRISGICHNDEDHDCVQCQDGSTSTHKEPHYKCE